MPPSEVKWRSPENSTLSVILAQVGTGNASGCCSWHSLSSPHLAPLSSFTPKRLSVLRMVATSCGLVSL